MNMNNKDACEWNLFLNALCEHSKGHTNLSFSKETFDEAKENNKKNRDIYSSYCSLEEVFENTLNKIESEESKKDIKNLIDEQNSSIKGKIKCDLTRDFKKAFKPDKYSEINKQKYFSVDDFFDEWFCKSGDAYYFVFRHNLDVTNMQFAELKSLITQYLTEQFNYNNKVIYANNIHLISIKDFNEQISSFFEIFDNSKFNSDEYIENCIKVIVDAEWNRIKDYIIIDYFHGSCAVYIPFMYKLNLEKVCANSGYIFSCGKKIYIKETNKARYEKDFADKLNNYLEKNSFGDSKILFKVYSTKDGSKNDQNDQDCLNKLKIDISKFYMGENTILDVLHKMENDSSNHFPYITDKLCIDPYNIVDLESSEGNENVEKNKTSIWLHRDFKLNFSCNSKEKPQYYICYQQMYKNHNPFYKFEENKPAWIEPVTIPHTLLAAMLNLAEIENMKVNSHAKVEILDPFGGTGTTFFEAQKFSNVNVTSRDIEPTSDLLFKDNKRFFRGHNKKKNEELKKYRESFLELLDYLYNHIKAYENNEIEIFLGENTDNKKITFYKKYCDFIDKLFNIYIQGKGRDIVSDVKIILDNTSIIYDKYLFYIIYRTIYKYLITSKSSIKVSPEITLKTKKSWTKIFIKETKYYVDLLKSIIENKDMILLAEKRGTIPQRILDNTDYKYLVFPSNYSYATTINFELYSGLDNNIIEEKNVLSMEEENKYDIIVTDPPYGFNTNEDPQQLLHVYTKGIEKLIKSLKNSGQLILSLPEASYNGQQLYSFTQRKSLVQKIISIAKLYNKEIVNPASSLTEDTKLFRPPYYWKSTTVLQRSILHFRFRPINFYCNHLSE